MPLAATGSEKPRRILAIDYGRKRIGLALSDELNLTAHPFSTLIRVNRHKDLQRLREICRQNGVRHIVVGLPLHLTGQAGEMAEEVSRFATRLRKELGISVELLDERLTTWEAKQMATRTPSSLRRQGPFDHIAAAILLRDYLEGKHHQTQATATERG